MDAEEGAGREASLRVFRRSLVPTGGLALAQIAWCEVGAMGHDLNRAAGVFVFDGGLFLVGEIPDDGARMERG